MAEPDNTIDPNDLESIDALLDEAELESIESQEEESDLQSETDDLIEQQEAAALQESVDELDLTDFEGIEQPQDQQEDGFEETLESRPLDSMTSTADGGYAAQMAQQDEDFDDFLSRRAENKKNGNELTVAEMDTLKSMIIGFGSTLVVLALIAIGIATWGALGANSADSPSADAFEEIMGEAELARTTSQANEMVLKDLNRKLDALSFQLDQATGDVIALNHQPLTAGSRNLNPIDQNGNNRSSQMNLNDNVSPVVNGVQNNASLPAANGQNGATPALQQPIAVTADMSNLEGKVDEVSRSMALAQRRVVEINNRVKSLQQQYSTVLQSMKQVEKNMLEDRLAEQKVIEEEKQAELEKLEEEKLQDTKPTSYHYRAPGALNYESGERSSYP